MMQSQDIFSTRDYLITGGSGLVGTALNGGKKPSSSVLNLLSPKSTFEWFEKNQVRNVIHCAGRVGGIGANSAKKGTFLRENLMMTINLFESSRVSGVDKIASFLSTCIFPDNVKYPLTVDQIFNGPPHDSNYGYAHAKRIQYVQAMAYREEYGMNIVSLVPCNIYGINDNFNISSGHVIPSLIHKFYAAMKNKTNVEIWGTGREKREFLFANDLHQIVAWVMDNYNEQEPLIISPDEEYEIGDVVELIRKEFEFKGEVTYNGEMSGQFRKPSDSSKLKKLMNPEFTTLESGIRQTVNWFVKNYKKARK